MWHKFVHLVVGADGNQREHVEGPAEHGGIVAMEVGAKKTPLASS